MSVDCTAGTGKLRIYDMMAELVLEFIREILVECADSLRVCGAELIVGEALEGHRVGSREVVGVKVVGFEVGLIVGLAVVVGAIVVGFDVVGVIVDGVTVLGAALVGLVVGLQEGSLLGVALGRIVG